MSRRPPNEPIGEVECPRKGCAAGASVYRYRLQAKAKTARRFAGRLYCVCTAGHRSDDQDWLLEHANLWRPDEKHDAPAQPTAPPKRSSSRPAPQAKPKATPAPPAKSKPWGFW